MILAADARLSQTFVDAFIRQHQIGFDFIYAAGSFHLISRRETSEQI